MKKVTLPLSLVLVFLALLFLGDFLYKSRFKKIEIKDLSQAQTLTLVANSKIVYGLEASVVGYLDDSAKIGNLVLGKGEVNALLYTGDCYVDTFQINYQPYKAKAGNLTVKYQFSTD